MRPNLRAPTGASFCMQEDRGTTATAAGLRSTGQEPGRLPYPGLEFNVGT